MQGGSHRPTAFGWINHSEDNGETAGSVGGTAIRLIAGGSLFIGDTVILSAADTVNKGIVTGDHIRIIGVVVGGFNTDMSVLQDDALIGTFVASLVNQPVLVAIAGVVKVIADAAIAFGAKIAPSTTVAGRVRTAAVTTDLAAGDTGKILGTAMNAAAGAASVFRVLIDRH